MGDLYVEGLFGYQKCRAAGNDMYYTPNDIAKLIVEYFKPTGTILEPCAGNGVFLQYIPTAKWCEISKGINFFEYKEKVNWIITNPPFSKITPFLIHSMQLANNIVFLINVPALFTIKRVREIHNNNYGIKKILYIKQADTYKHTGRQLAAVYLKRGHTGFCRFVYTKELVKSYNK